MFAQQDQLKYELCKRTAVNLFLLGRKLLSVGFESKKNIYIEKTGKNLKKFMHNSVKTLKCGMFANIILYKIMECLFKFKLSNFRLCSTYLPSFCTWNLFKSIFFAIFNLNAFMLSALQNYNDCALYHWIYKRIHI